jgi:DNA-binding protein
VEEIPRVIISLKKPFGAYLTYIKKQFERDEVGKVEIFARRLAILRSADIHEVLVRDGFREVVGSLRFGTEEWNGRPTTVMTYRLERT